MITKYMIKSVFMRRNSFKGIINHFSHINISYDGNEGIENTVKVRLNRCLRPLTRKLADQAILEGQVVVNGKLATVGMKITESDKVFVSGIGDIDVKVPHFNQIFHPFELESKRLTGSRISLENRTNSKEYIYFKLWKPSGYKSSTKLSEPLNLMELLSRDLDFNKVGKLHIIGSLSQQAAGVMLITNDQRLVDVVTSQKYPLDCVYSIESNESLPRNVLQKYSLDSMKYLSDDNSSKVNEIDAITNDDEVSSDNSLSVEKHANSNISVTVVNEHENK